MDKIGAEVFDDLGIPLLVDAFDYEARWQSFQLFQRGTRWTTLGNAAKNFFTTRSVNDVAAEWAGGLDFRGTMTKQYERELIAKLNDPRVRTVDCFTPEFDHVAHLHRDRASQLRALQNIDALVGRIWSAIETSAMAEETVLVLVSDHGLNTDERIYSQGYNLMNLLNGAVGGAHHVITDRLIGNAVTASDESFFLKGQSAKYPTVLLDLDGNERASIHLRNSDLNALHGLLLQLKNKGSKGELKAAVIVEFFGVLDRNRARWTKTSVELQEELGALRRWIEQQQALHRAQPKKWSKADQDAGRDKEARRIFVQLDQASADEKAYSNYARTLQNLLALRRDGFDPAKIEIESVIAPRAMGEPNAIFDLQNYVAGVQPRRTVNYFALLTNVKVRNNVQIGIDSRPVDFIAVRIPQETILPALNSGETPDQDAIWIYGGEQRQALILARRAKNGELLLRYLPASDLTQGASGQIRFTRIGWQSGLPLKIWEDDKLRVAGNREEWLSRWHSEVDWLRATHETKYSNALIGLHEHLTLHDPPSGTDPSPDGQLLRRFRLRQRRLTEADLLVLANDHWNFNVRDFNPGGNHGSLFRVSTHSTLMFAGGARTGIPKASLITEPYDSLSFVPTIFALMHKPPREAQLLPAFPGRIIKEVISR